MRYRDYGDNRSGMFSPVRHERILPYWARGANASARGPTLPAGAGVVKGVKMLHGAGLGHGSCEGAFALEL